MIFYLIFFFSFQNNINISPEYLFSTLNLKDENIILIDVRTKEEIIEASIENSIHIDYYDDSFKSQLETLDKEKTFYIYCRSGNRSMKTLHYMKEIGYEKVYNLNGGIIAWQELGFPVLIKKKETKN